MNDLLERLNKIYGEQTFNCSDICRKIVFALLTMDAALAYSDGNLYLTPWLILLTLFLVLYLILNVLQYFLTAISYRKNYNEIIKATSDGIPFEELQNIEIKKRSETNSLSFNLLIAKVTLLPIIFIVIVIELINRI